MAMMKDGEGVTWGYPRLGLMGHCHFNWFRSDWMEELGMEVPKTWEEMEAFMGGAKAKHPESVVATSSRLHLMMNTLGAFTENGVSNWIDPADNMLKPVELHPAYRDWVEKMHEWWAKDWFQKETFAGPDFTAMLKSLSIGTWMGWYSRITGWWGDDVRGIKADLKTDADYTFYKTMTGPKGWLVTVNSYYSKQSYMIPRKSKSPDAVIRYVDWCYEGVPDRDPTNSLVPSTGIPGEDWEWVDKAALKARSITVPIGAPCEQKFDVRLQAHLGMGTEPLYTGVQWEREDGTFYWSRHNKHVYTYAADYEDRKMPIDFDVPYDNTLVDDKFPGRADLDRLFDEESIKFITGIRPLSEWDDFLEEAEGAGLQQWSEAYTEQYRRYHPG